LKTISNDGAADALELFEVAPKRIEHGIDPEQRRSKRLVFSQCAFVRANTRQIPMCQSIIGILNDAE
jgi:hypothetical protein